VSQPQTRSEDEAAADLKRRVVETLQLQPGQTAADVGCGDGFYTIPLANTLRAAGKVFAVDIDEGALSKLKQRLVQEGLKNVEVIKGQEDDPLLPLSGIDAVLVANAYHEMSAHEAILRHVRAALKPGGLLVIMEGIWENREKQSRDEQTKHHQLAPSLARQEVVASGFEVVSVRDPFLERAPDEDGKSRWWLIVARNPTTGR
jgi:ubiquinone/menaquinone biosynthesis C-methylase UbiE